MRRWLPLGGGRDGIRLVPAARTLSEVASTIAGRRCEVTYASNALDPASVVARDSVIVLHPERASFGDYLLAAALLRHRNRLEADGGRQRIGTRRRLVAAARDYVRTNLPGAEALGADMGRARARLVWDRLPQRALEADDFMQGAEIGAALSRRSYMQQPKSSLAALLEAARRGHLPAFKFASFPELDIVRHSLPTARELPTDADQEMLEDWRTMSPGIVADAVRCYRDSAEIVDDEWASTLLVSEGSQIAEHALHDAYVASLAGIDLPVFQAEELDSIVQWDPDRFVVVLGFDMAGLPDSCITNPVPSRSMLGVFCRSFQVLGVGVRIVGFWDHEVAMPNGKSRYLTVDVMVKDFDEPFDDAAALRVANAMNAQRFAAPTSVAQAALHHRVLFDGLVEEVHKRDAQVAQVYYFATRWSTQFWGKQHNTAQRTADAIEQIVAAAKAQTPTVKKWDGLLSLPRAVRDVAKEGGWITTEQLGFDA